MMVERIFSGLLLLVALIMLYMAWGYTAPIAYDPMGPRPYPMLLLGLLAIGAAVLAFRPARFIQTIEYGWTKPIVKNLCLCTVAMLAYAIFFEILGYIIATTLMAWAVGVLFDGRVLKSFIASLVMAVLTFYMFDKLLDVSLPSGILSFLGV